MSKPLKFVGVVAGGLALIATGVGAFAVAGSALAATAGSIATISGLVATAANIGAQALQKPPPARGSVTQMLISPNAPQPYVMGEGYFAGVLRHDTAYGATLNKVPNPYRFLAVVYSGGGPIQSISPRVDFATVSSWYSTFLYTGTKLGTVPDTALTPQWSGTPGWSTAHELSGQAAIGWSLKFDKDGKRFAGGVPVLGAYGQWVKVYDPRLDSTQPGGSGAHRLGNEATYAYSDNPALHAGTYAYGRYQNGKRVLGVGLPANGIDWAVVAAWANVCEANSWTMFGVVYEPGDRWANLKDICIAGGAEPVVGGVLSFRYSAPTVALDTITEADLTEGPQSVTAMQSWRDRINTAVPQYRSEVHNWEIVDAEAVVNSTFLAEDGEEKREVWPFSFVKESDQAAQLAAYRIFDSRELNPITLTVKPRLRNYRPGECLALDLPELALDTLAIIRRRSINPVTMEVTLELMSETTAKHAFCLGRTGTPPPTPALGQTAEERDELAAAATTPAGYDTSLITTSYVTDADPLDGLMQATASAITIETHSRTYADRTVSVTGATLALEDDGTTPIDDATLYHLYYDDPDRSGGSVTLKATRNSQSAATSEANPSRHYIGSILTDVIGGTGSSGGGASPPGWNPINYHNSD